MRIRRAIWLGGLAVALPAFAANLAPEAAYSVTLYGFAWRGQLVPGTNSPRTFDGYMAAPPWQGPPLTLIDGKRDDPAVISWYWTNMDKRVAVTFDLRRPCRVNGVQAFCKSGTGHSFASGRVRFADNAAALEQARDLPVQVAGEEASWTGEAQTGRFLRLVLDTPIPTLSLAEVQIEGKATGPVAPDAPAPGLIPVPPRDLAPLIALPAKTEGETNLALRSQTVLKLSSRHYDDKARGMVDDEVAVKSDESGRSLRDGDPTTAISSFAGWYVHKSITAELDLGQACQIDRIVVWSAGHDTARSYVNTFCVWTQAGPGAPWVPAGDTRNPVLPAEKPAVVYPLVSTPLERPARTVRLMLSGVAQSADVMQVGEIEIWGRSLAAPLAVRPMRVKQAVPPIEPVALGKLAPSYDWVTKERLRGLYTYVGRTGETETLTRAVDAGYNCLLVHTMGKWQSEQGWPEEAARWLKVQKDYGLRVIVSWPYGSDERYGNTQFGAYQPGGSAVWKKTPCPLSREYWNRVVGDRAEIAAQIGLTGMVVDVEMYGADSTRYAGPCVCEDCWKRFVETHLEGVAPADVALADRPAWLEANGLQADCKRWQELEVMAILRGIQQRVHAANPNFLLGYMLDFEALPGLARGFGTPTMPALMLSETEYAGNVGALTARVDRLTDEGYPALYWVGLSPCYLTPERFAELIPEVSATSAGFWVWSCLVYDEKAPKGYGHLAGHTAEEYWGATRRGTQTLTEKLRVN